MTIGKKLYILAALNVLLTLIVSAIGLYGIERLNPETSTLIKNLQGVRNTMEGDMMHDALRGDALRALLIAATKSNSFGTKADVLADLKDHGETFKGAMKEAGELGLGDASQHALSKVEPLVGAYIDITRDLVDAVGSENDKAWEEYERFQKSFSELEDAMEKTTDAVSAEAESTLASDISTAHSLKYGLYGVAIVALLLSCSISFWLVKNVVRSVTRYVSQLTRTFKELQQQAGRLSDTSNRLGTGSSEQASAIQETVASIAEMLSMLQQTNECSQQSIEVAGIMGKKTDQGGRTMSKLASSMESIQSANAQLAEIANIIEQISAKAAVINDIVFKTQLLSFNASIEAARAGQHGRGFAVVAEEVGNLAEMSGNSAREIQSLLDDSRKQVAHIVESVQKRVLEGEQVTGEALAIFGEIAKESSNIGTFIHKINEATKEQEAGVQQISVAMSQMDNSAQRNNIVATDTKKASDDLQRNSQELSQIVRGFTEMICASKTGSVRPMKSRQSTQIIELDQVSSLKQDFEYGDLLPEGSDSMFEPYRE